MTYNNYFVFMIIYCISLLHEWITAGALYSNLSHYAVLTFLIQICLLVQQTKWDVYYYAKILSLVLSETFLLSCLNYYPLIMTDFYCACIVPHLMHKLYGSCAALTKLLCSIRSLTNWFDDVCFNLTYWPW